MFSSAKLMCAPEVLTAYKKADRKVKSVSAVFSEDARVNRQFSEDSMASLPTLSPNPPKFTPDGGQLSQENLEAMNINPDGFIWPEEENLFCTLLQTHQNHFVFEDSQRDTFREDYFSSYIIPVVLHSFNKISIRDAGLPSNLDNLMQPFAGCQCYTVFDLHWGFDARKVHSKSRDLTAFLTPLGLL
ncbi:uncharacterized protein PHACADRAFT_178145 [Phanerochaete carnosa HHB-10118-sp]|uniref:Uncharacterized protein n=1 Tax=Phanerochaete carnosa (strain HHB-10118-sp) TaxID=650164 RepID=K5VGS7_PHACS|nr:uncharacterized protein PHACADRAFT_178145 [Phanerochaete carnosa HHB-10118-sp]EKM50403.1 hypothetical protein PHACADRAFT_178145 [Phanerochaete carnosa HHB-10118-sp]